MFSQLTKSLRIARVVGLVLLVLAVGGLAAWFATQQPKAVSASPAPGVVEVEKITVSAPNCVLVPESIARHLTLKTVVVKRADQSMPLPLFQGTLAADSNSLQRIHSRFPGEIVALGQVGQIDPTNPPASISKAGTTPTLQYGDKVEAGQLLAIVWSKDLGEKKSELINVLSKYKLDSQVAGRLRDLYNQSGTAEKSVLDAERIVQEDRINIERIERTLQSWRLTEADIAKVRAETDNLTNQDAVRANAADWARVEVRATQAGVILEKNIGVGDIVDTATDLFKIGNLKSLAVWAHVYEDDLPQLAELPKPMAWTISLPARPGTVYDGKLELIGSVIDPNQHTALVSGHVDNPNGELKIGQSVTVSLKRPASAWELIVPTDALVEDGVESIVIVQPDPTKLEYERRRVRVLRRTRDWVYIQEGLLFGLRAEEHVVATGSLLFQEAMKAAVTTVPTH